MSNELTVKKTDKKEYGALFLGTGLAVASMILVPAVAMRLGLGSSLTGALRIALMRASSKVANGSNQDSADTAIEMSCH